MRNNKVKVVTDMRYNFMMQDLVQKYCDYNPKKGEVIDVCVLEEGIVEISATYSKKNLSELEEIINILNKGNINVKIKA